MGIHVEWHADRVIRATFRENWTLDEYGAIAGEIRSMAVSAAPANIYLIVDMMQSREMPGGIVRYAIMNTSYVPENMPILALTGASVAMEMTLSVVRPLMPQVNRRLRLMDTVAEAEKFIEVARSAIGDMPDKKNRLNAFAH